MTSYEGQPFKVGDRAMVKGSKKRGRVVGVIAPSHPTGNWLITLRMDSELNTVDYREYYSNTLERTLA